MEGAQNMGRTIPHATDAAASTPEGVQWLVSIHKGWVDAAGNESETLKPALQAEEIVMLSSLAREAAELLWEMVATEDVGDAMQQMRDNATAIQVLVCDPHTDIWSSS
jgi:hypothetical protein